MRDQPLFPYAGARPLQEYFIGANDTGGGVTGTSNLTNPPTFMPNGCIVPGYDLYWGGAEFQYCLFSSTVAAWALCTIKPALANGRFGFVAAAVANTANQARPVGQAIQQMATGQYGWVIVSGLRPVLSTASVAADATVGITGVGTVGATSAGKEIENMVSVLPATTTVVKANAFVQSGSPIIQFTGNNTIDGLFVGVALSGTGIPANAVVQNIDPDGRRVFMSTGPGVAGAALNATATGGVSVTGTYNDGTNFYNVVQSSRAFVQGRIT